MFSSRTTLRISVVCCAAIVVATGNPARAQSPIPSDAVYNDVKQIIEDLISREAAHTVTPHLACLSGRIAAVTDDASAVTFATDAKGKVNEKYVLEATKLFPRTIQSIYDGQYGKLGPIVSDEASGAVAYALYHILTLPIAVQAIQQSAKEVKKVADEENELAGKARGMFAMVRAEKAAAARKAQVATKAADDAMKAIETNDPAAALYNADAAANALAALNPNSDQAIKAGAAKKRVAAAAAALQEAKAMTSPASIVKPATDGKDAQSKATPPGSPDFTLLPDYAVDNCSRALGKKLDNKVIGDGPSALDAACQGAGPADGLDPSIKEYACDISYAVKHVIMNDPTGAEGYLERAIAETVRVFYTDADDEDAVAVRTALVPLINELMSGAKKPAQVVVDVEHALTALSLNLDKKEEAQLTLYLRQARDLWNTTHLTGREAFSIAEFAAGIAVASATNACSKADKPAVCDVIVTARDKIRVGEQLWPIIRAASSGNEVDAAQRAIGMLFAGLKAHCDKEVKPTPTLTLTPTQEVHPPDWALPKKGPTASVMTLAPTPPPTTAPNGESTWSCESFHFYEELVDAVVVYVYQVETKGTPTDEARSVLRSTAENLIEEVGVNGGIDRMPWSPWVWLWPDLVLRYQWSGSYANGVNGTGRFTAALPMFKLRKRWMYYRLSYVSTTLSFIDPLAPFAEIADRPPATSSYSNGVWWNVISPRLDVNVGVPALSKHLLVGGGVAYRPVALPKPSSTTASSTDYGSCTTNWSFSDCLEFGLYIKYAI